MGEGTGVRIQGAGAEAPLAWASPTGRGGKTKGETSIISLQGPGRNRPGSGEKQPRTALFTEPKAYQDCQKSAQAYCGNRVLSVAGRVSNAGNVHGCPGDEKNGDE